MIAPVTILDRNILVSNNCSLIVTIVRPVGHGLITFGQVELWP